MRDSPWYVLSLIVAFGLFCGYVYSGAQVRLVKVQDKYTEAGRGRYGSTSTKYLIKTDQGKLQLLSFPVIGYLWGIDEAHAAIRVGSTINVRVAYFPPVIISKNPRLQILSVW